MKPKAGRGAAENAIFNRLSPRLKELALMLAKGMSNKEIALETGLTIGTVKNHISAILNAYQVSSRTKAALISADPGVDSPLESNPIKGRK